MFEINRPGSTLLISDIMNNASSGTDLWTLFQLAASPAINTTYYDASNQNGTVMACDTAYTAMTTVLNDNSINSLPELINARCSSAGFNMSDIDESNRCRQILGATLQWTTGSTMNADKYFQQTAMAQKLHDVIQNGNSNQAIAAQSNIGVISTTSAMGVIANEYLPIIRAVVTCVAVGLMPFLLLFITTPIGAKSIALLTGFFVWLTAWGVADALTHTLATNYAFTYFDQVRGNGTGYAAIMLMPSAATKTLGLFGMLRMAGMVLASIVSTTLIPAGSYAMTRFAEHFASPVQGQASAAGTAAMTPTGSAQAMEGYQGSRVSWGQTAAFGQDRLTMAKQFAASKNTQSSLTESSMMSRDSITGGMRGGRASGFEGATSTLSTEKSISAFHGPKSASDQLSKTNAAQRASNTTMSQAGRQLSIKSAGMGGFKTGGKMLDQRQADQVTKR
jgi:conjugal transfer mating pair stabilization protein TraG